MIHSHGFIGGVALPNPQIVAEMMRTAMRCGWKVVPDGGNPGASLLWLIGLDQTVTVGWDRPRQKHSGN